MNDMLAGLEHGSVSGVLGEAEILEGVLKVLLPEGEEERMKMLGEPGAV